MWTRIKIVTNFLLIPIINAIQRDQSKSSDLVKIFMAQAFRTCNAKLSCSSTIATHLTVLETKRGFAWKCTINGCNTFTIEIRNHVGKCLWVYIHTHTYVWCIHVYERWSVLCPPVFSPLGLFPANIFPALSFPHQFFPCQNFSTTVLSLPVFHRHFLNEDINWRYLPKN